jgi:hypothetical protein
VRTPRLLGRARHAAGAAAGAFVEESDEVEDVEDEDVEELSDAVEDDVEDDDVDEDGVDELAEEPLLARESLR